MESEVKVRKRTFNARAISRLLCGVGIGNDVGPVVGMVNVTCTLLVPPIVVVPSVEPVGVRAVLVPRNAAVD